MECSSTECCLLFGPIVSTSDHTTCNFPSARPIFFFVIGVLSISYIYSKDLDIRSAFDSDHHWPSRVELLHANALYGLRCLHVSHSTLWVHNYCRGKSCRLIIQTIHAAVLAWTGTVRPDTTWYLVDQCDGVFKQLQRVTPKWFMNYVFIVRHLFCYCILAWPRGPRLVQS